MPGNKSTHENRSIHPLQGPFVKFVEKGGDRAKLVGQIRGTFSGKLTATQILSVADTAFDSLYYTPPGSRSLQVRANINSRRNGEQLLESVAEAIITRGAETDEGTFTVSWNSPEERGRLLQRTEAVFRKYQAVAQAYQGYQTIHGFNRLFIADPASHALGICGLVESTLKSDTAPKGSYELPLPKVSDEMFHQQERDPEAVRRTTDFIHWFSLIKDGFTTAQLAATGHGEITGEQFRQTMLDTVPLHPLHIGSKELSWEDLTDKIVKTFTAIDTLTQQASAQGRRFSFDREMALQANEYFLSYWLSAIQGSNIRNLDTWTLTQSKDARKYIEAIELWQDTTAMHLMSSPEGEQAQQARAFLTRAQKVTLSDPTGGEPISVTHGLESLVLRRIYEFLLSKSDSASRVLSTYSEAKTVLDTYGKNTPHPLHRKTMETALFKQYVVRNVLELFPPDSESALEERAQTFVANDNMMLRLFELFGGAEAVVFERSLEQQVKKSRAGFDEDEVKEYVAAELAGVYEGITQYLHYIPTGTPEYPLTSIVTIPENVVGVETLFAGAQVEFYGATPRNQRERQIHFALTQQGGGTAIRGTILLDDTVSAKLWIPEGENYPLTAAFTEYFVMSVFSRLCQQRADDAKRTQSLSTTPIGEQGDSQVPFRYIPRMHYKYTVDARSQTDSMELDKTRQGEVVTTVVEEHKHLVPYAQNAVRLQEAYRAALQRGDPREIGRVKAEYEEAFNQSYEVNPKRLAAFPESVLDVLVHLEYEGQRKLVQAPIAAYTREQQVIVKENAVKRTRRFTRPYRVDGPTMVNMFSTINELLGAI